MELDLQMQAFHKVNSILLYIKTLIYYNICTQVDQSLLNENFEAICDAICKNLSHVVKCKIEFLVSF